MAGLADPAAFDAWRRQLARLVAFGQLEAYAVGDRAAWLVEAVGRYRNVVLGAGDLDDAALEALFTAVADRSAAVTWGQEVGPDWAPRLAPRGAASFVHQGFALDLAQVADLRGPAVPDPAVVPWDEAYRAEVVALGATALAGTLAGLTTVLPAAPTRAALTAYLEALPVMAAASSLHLTAGRVTGLLLLTREDEGPVLQLILVDPAVRAEGVGRRMLRRSQRALLAAGEAGFRFWTTESNAAVHRLYAPGEITPLGARACGYWLRV